MRFGLMSIGRFALVVPCVGALAVFSLSCSSSAPTKEAVEAKAALPELLGLEPLLDRSPDPDLVEVDLSASTSTHEFAAGKKTNVLAYNGKTPGPMIVAQVGNRVRIHFKNDLNEKTTVHWHGLRISDQMDGSPRIQTPIEPGETFVYDFIVPDAGTFWFHSHVSTIEQVDRGLYGAFVVHEKEPPRFNHERVFLLDDVRLGSDYQIAPFLTSGHDIGAGRSGNILLANGRPDGLTVELQKGAVERWRLVNTSNARLLSLGMKGASFRIIATDGGRIPKPYAPTKFDLPPGGRVDLEVRLDKDATVTPELTTFVQVLNEDQTVSTRDFAMVKGTWSGSVEPIEPAYSEVTLPPIRTDGPNKGVKLSGGIVDGNVEFTMNGVSGHKGEHPLFGTYKKGDPMMFSFTSNVSPFHPFHLHGQFFQVVSRNGKAVDEPGLRDTVALQLNEAVTILTYFENPGQWMFHCHIAEHGENGMMAEIKVTE